MKPLALTMGDPAGIGPELILRAWRATRESGAPFFAIAAPGPLAELAVTLGLETPIVEVEPEGAAEAFTHALPVVSLVAPAGAKPGTPDARFAAATLESIERAVTYIFEGRARAVVTNPIAKKILYEAGFRHPGHTEFLGELSRVWGSATEPVMMIWSPLLAVVPVTIHIPLSEVPKQLTTELIVATARTVHRDLRSRFGVERPRLSLAGLNPHAGEGGALGREEIETIIPAVEILRSEGIDVVGPLPADTMFHLAARARYDAALTMYHDQGLVPAKTLAFDDGVNITLGLPFIRTSPDHGTAFDIAGHGRANPSSLLAALKLADRLSR